MRLTETAEVRLNKLRRYGQIAMSRKRSHSIVDDANTVLIRMTEYQYHIKFVTIWINHESR